MSVNCEKCLTLFIRAEVDVYNLCLKPQNIWFTMAKKGQRCEAETQKQCHFCLKDKFTQKLKFIS